LAGGGWGTLPRRKGALGPTHEGGRQVRRLGIDNVAEIEVGRGVDGLPESRGEAAVGRGQMALRGGGGLF
jgi:hypothetical protein